MSFLFLMIKIALVIYVIKFFWGVAFDLLSLRSARKAELAVMDDIRTANDFGGDAE